MLVNVKFFKKTFLISFFLLITTSLLANEKNQIVAQLNNLNSLEFTFDQLINEKTEKGSCLLEFPGKLKCNYFDDKKKELVINNKRLAITQKRYNKTYHYPISKSPFLNILYKDKLLEIVQSGELELTDQIIKLVYFGDNEITIFFDKKNLDLKGWEIKDQYNNNINFSLNIIARNDSYKRDSQRQHLETWHRINNRRHQRLLAQQKRDHQLRRQAPYNH